MYFSQKHGRFIGEPDEIAPHMSQQGRKPASLPAPGKPKPTPRKRVPKKKVTPVGTFKEVLEQAV